MYIYNKNVHQNDFVKDAMFVSHWLVHVMLCSGGSSREFVDNSGKL